MSWPSKRKTSGRSVRAVVRKAIRSEQRRRSTWFSPINYICEGLILPGCVTTDEDCCPGSGAELVLISNTTLQGPAAGVVGPYGDNMLVEHVKCSLMFTQIPGGSNTFAEAAIDYGVFRAGLRRGEIDSTGAHLIMNPLNGYDHTEGRFLRQWEHFWYPEYQTEQCTTASNITGTVAVPAHSDSPPVYGNVTGASPGVTGTVPAVAAAQLIPAWNETVTETQTGTQSCGSFRSVGSNFKLKFDYRRKIALKANQYLVLEIAWARTKFPASMTQIQPAMLLRGTIDLMTTSV